MATPTRGLTATQGEWDPNEASLAVKSFGIGASAPSDDNVLDVGGAAAPALSASDVGRIYFDLMAGKFKVSEDGGAYANLVGGNVTIGGEVTGGDDGALLFVDGTDLAQDVNHLFWDNSLKSLNVMEGGLYVSADTTNPSVSTTADGYEMLFLKTHGTYGLTNFVLTNAIDRGSGAINSQTMRDQVLAAQSFRVHTATVDGSAASQRRFLIEAAGNVVVGAGSGYSQKLEVEGSVGLAPASAADSALIRTASLDSGIHHVLQYFDGNWLAGFFRLASDDYRFRIQVPGSGTTRVVDFYDNVGAASRLYADMITGHVGIGRTSLGARLDLDNQAVAIPIQLWRDNGTEVARMEDGGDFGLGVVPTEKLSLKDHSLFDGSESNTTTGAVQTTNNTPTTAKSIALQDNSVYWIEVEVVGRRTDSTVDRAVYTVLACVYRQGGGGATLEGTALHVSADIETAGATLWDASITVSGNNALITVTGDTGHTVNWACSVRYQRVSGSA